MILTGRQGNVAVRSVEFGTSAIPPPLLGSGGLANLWHGQGYVPLATALEVPAVAQAITLISSTIGVMPMMIHRQLDARRKEPATNVWQWKLLHDEPFGGMPSSRFYEGIARDMLSTGNAYVEKLRTNERVSDLRLLRPSLLSYSERRDEWTYHDAARSRRVPAVDMIHFVGETTEGADKFGTSPIERHATAIGAIRNQERWLAVYFLNGARPDLAVEWNDLHLEPEQAEQWMSVFENRHGGLENSHRPMIVPSGVKVTDLKRTLVDMAYVQLVLTNKREVAAMFNMPPYFLGVAEDNRPLVSDEWEVLLQTTIHPWWHRIEATLGADPELFGYGPLTPEFDSLRLSDVGVSKYQAYHLLRQDGVASINDVRGAIGWPILDEPGADDHQLVPVGGTAELQPHPDTGDEEGES